ncbi:MAG: ABC transporter ATP-binding protein [Muribaculaceae bacterium]|mgnify:CR=1 FL=1|nr:ABC transporter ATP-binding protein [Muribaculaceae bacterium]MCI9054795.1 ABC transporter ATP-binding protein [Muribaculaceae bacterium]
MITLTDVNKIYRTKTIETQALENVNLHIGEGEFVSIMGPSGCGKSTLLNIIGLLDTPTSGKVELVGKDVAGLSDKALAALRNQTLGFVFQSFHLISSLNVIDNVMVPLMYRSGAGDKRALAREALEKVGLSHRLHHMPAQLSGGQAQRVAIARAIVGDPKIILADEPCGNLDSRMGAEIMELLHGLNRDEKRTIVMVTHNEEQAAATDRIVHFFDGRQVK